MPTKDHLVSPRLSLLTRSTGAWATTPSELSVTGYQRKSPWPELLAPTTLENKNFIGLQ